jgi:hypothetical protein
MNRKNITLESKVQVIENEDEVHFIGEAVNTDHVSMNELEDINRWLKNQPIVYRHDHPAKKKGGTIYGRVVDSNIVQEDGKKKIVFKSRMKQTLQRHKDLIKLAKKQQDIGKPIRYSVAFERIPKGDDFEAEVWEVAVTNNPVVKDAINHSIEMENKNMGDKIDKDEIVAEYQKQFEEKIGFSIEELEDKLEEKDETIQELEAKVAKAANEKESISTETKSIIQEYSNKVSDLADKVKSQSKTIKELQAEADQAKRMPLVNQIYELEENEVMKERYKNPQLWSIEDLKDQLREWEAKAAKLKNMNKKVMTQELRGSHEFEDPEKRVETEEFEEKMKEKVSSNLKKALGWD